MANDVKIIFSAHDLRAIDLGSQNHFAVGVRPCEKISEGIDDAASSSGHDRIRIVPEICGRSPGGKSRRRLN